MREIEFRGKVRGCNEWVYGSLVYMPFDDGSEYCCIMDNNCDDEYLPFINNDSGTFDGYMTPVDKETIGQYTGLCDKNRKKIYEGDIIKHKRNKTLSGKQRYIYYCINYCESERCLRAFVTGIRGYAYEISFKSYIINEQDLEIVGNIHDNPELLEVKYDN